MASQASSLRQLPGLLEVLLDGAEASTPLIHIPGGPKTTNQCQPVLSIFNNSNDKIFCDYDNNTKNNSDANDNNSTDNNNKQCSYLHVPTLVGYHVS